MSNRNLRRLAAKMGGQGAQPGAQLATALQSLKELTGQLKAVVPEAGQDLNAAQDLLREFKDFMRGYQGQVDDLRYQLERQRAVFLRMLRSSGRAVAIPEDAATLLYLEATYSAEYDAMRFLCGVAMLPTQEDP